MNNKDKAVLSGLPMTLSTQYTPRKDIKFFPNKRRRSRRKDKPSHYN